MCDRRGIHIFLGAPPPPSCPPSQPRSEPPATWSHLQLTWRDGRLTPAAGEVQTFGEAERTEDEDEDEDARQNKDCLPNPGADPVPGPEAGQDGLETSERTDAEEDGQDSTSLHHYLDSCFPTARPAPGPGPGQTPGPGPRAEDRPPLVVAPPSTHTHYLATWTLSQVLVLRGRHGGQSASSPEKTPPRGPLWPPSVSSGTPELFSQSSPSLEPSAELFSQTGGSPRVEEGGVVLQVTAEGVLCSQESKTIQESPSKSPIESPSKSPIESPIESPSKSPIESPSKSPIESPSKSPIESPSKSPIESPSKSPIESPSKSPIESPSKSPIESPSKSPIESPSKSPIESPSKSPIESPSKSPIKSPSKPPIESPSKSSTKSPIESPSKFSIKSPSKSSIKSPIESPSKSPIESPSKSPIESPSKPPIESPSKFSIKSPSKSSIKSPIESPSKSSTKSPIESPSKSSIKSPIESPIKSPIESPIKSPSSKRPRISEESRTGAPGGPASSARLHSVPTLLPRCNRPGGRYSVLVAVVHPCHLKEVQVKSGPSAGTFVPLASIVVVDQSGVDRKVALWRRAAFWAVTVSPGDVVFITGLQVTEDRWRGETLLQSTFSSKLLNLGHVTSSASRPVTQVDSQSLSSLRDFVRERRPLLASLAPPPPQDPARLPYAPLRSLRVNTLVHALLRVTHTHLCSEWRGEAASSSRSALRMKVVVSVEQADGQQGALLLWGAAVDWLPRFSRDRNAVWDFHLLLVRDSLTSDLPELHSTPWSRVSAVRPSDRRAQDFLRPRRHPPEPEGAVELDLDTLLSQKYSGEVELRLQVVAFHFQDAPSSRDAPQPVMDGLTAPDAMLALLSGDVTYTGCGRCTAELDTDANGIYCPCYPCLPHTAVRRYYRPAVLTVRGRSLSQVSLHVPPEPLQMILSAPPDKLHRPTAPGSGLTNLQLAAGRLGSLLSLPRRTFVVRAQSHFLLDENGAAIHQELTLLHLQLPEGGAVTGQRL